MLTTLPAVIDGEDTQGDETLTDFADGVLTTYKNFAGLQRQKLILADYVLERQSEIDDPVTSAKSILGSRYAHIDSGSLEQALIPLANCFTVGDGTQPISVDGDPTEAFTESQAHLPEGYGQTVFLTFLQEVLNSSRPGGNSDDLLASLFTGLIADFESFMVSLLTDLYSKEPRSLSSKERSISWAQIFDLEDLAAFREDLIDQAVVDLMRGSLSDWLAALSRDHQIKVDDHANSAQLIENFQRRHVLVHNGGRVSRLYIAKCPKVSVDVGEHLAVSTEYFRDAADRLAVLALTLSANALLRHGQLPAQTVESRMADWTYELLLSRRYQAVHDYLSAVPFDRMRDAATAEVCRVNLWLSLKRLGRFDECRTEVEQWQVGHLKEKFQLAKFALLGDIAEAVELCREMRRSEHLPLRHWAEWPLLEEVREHEARLAQTGDTDGTPPLGLLESDETNEGATDEH